MHTLNNNDCGCSNTTISYSHCNNCSPVEPCDCPIKDLSTDCILFSEDNIECEGVIVVTKNKVLTDVLKDLVNFICTRFEEIKSFLRLKNIGTGAKVYAGDTLLGEKKIRSIKQSGNLISVVENTEDITLTLDTSTIVGIVTNTVTGAETKVVAGTNTTLSGNGTTATPYIINSPVVTGAETKVVAGTNTTISGTGTTISPYIVNSNGADGSETKVVAGTNISVTGAGTTSTPYVVNSTATGAETKINAGSNITVTGTGATGTPYIITSNADGSETKVVAGLGTTVSGTGTILTPYQINIPKNNVVNSGFFAGLDVGFPSTYTLGGDIIEATSQIHFTPDSVILVKFANAMPSTNYYLDIRLEGQSIDLNDDNDICTPVFKIISNLQAQIALREIVNNTQNLKVHIQAIAY